MLQAPHSQRDPTGVHGEDEFENENDLVAATLRYYDDEHEEESSFSEFRLKWRHNNTSVSARQDSAQRRAVPAPIEVW
jgi:hypothetical protein